MAQIPHRRGPEDGVEGWGSPKGWFPRKCGGRGGRRGAAPSPSGPLPSLLWGPYKARRGQANPVLGQPFFPRWVIPSLAVLVVWPGWSIPLFGRSHLGGTRRVGGAPKGEGAEGWVTNTIRFDPPQSPPPKKLVTPPPSPKVDVELLFSFLFCFLFLFFLPDKSQTPTRKNEDGDFLPAFIELLVK